ncbi:hypothetical protein [Caulobacter sp. LARHSG274]
MLVAALLTPALAVASSTGAGHISVIQVMDGGVVLFNHDGDRTALPGCATNQGRWAFDGSTPAGQAKLAVLMSAYALNKRIVITGLGACNQFGGMESVSNFYLAD